MKRIFGKLYIQVLIAVVLGAIVGVLVPETGAALKPLGDAFIKLIKMLLAPVIFLTVVTGIARMENMKELGRVGFRALIYFEVVSTLALVVGLVVVDVFKPGAGMNIDVARLDTSRPRVMCCRSCCFPSFWVSPWPKSDRAGKSLSMHWIA